VDNSGGVIVVRTCFGSEVVDAAFKISDVLVFAGDASELVDETVPDYP